MSLVTWLPPTGSTARCRALAPRVGAAERDHDRLAARPRHAFRGNRGGLDGGDGFFEVDAHAFAQAVRRAFAHAEDRHGSTRIVRLRDDDHDPGCTQVETDGFLPPRQNCAGTPPGTCGC